MPKKKLVPDFASEQEELAFWEKHDLEEFDHEAADDIILAIKPEPKKPVTVRLEPSLIAELKQVATRRDIPYQTLLRGLVKRGLDDIRRAVRRAG